MAPTLAVVVITLSFFAIIAEGASTYGTGAGGLLPLLTDRGPTEPTGSAVVTFQKIPGMPMYNVYFLLTQSGLSNISLAHIHFGKSSVSGPVVIPFTTAINFTMFQTDGLVSGLVQAPENVSRAIMMTPSDYYVNVHTVTQPTGAIRAQLANVETTPTSVPYDLYVQNLTTAVANNTLMASGSSTVSIYTLPKTYDGCITYPVIEVSRHLLTTYVGFAISVVNVTDLTMGHIHMGVAGVSGPVVVPFTPVINFTDFNTVGFATGVVPVDAMLAANITVNPAEYYVNLHSVTYPNGVLRVQLSERGILNFIGCGSPATAASASMVTKPNAVFLGGVVTMMALIASFV